MRVNPMTGLTDSESLSYNTVRVEAELDDGQVSIGTGFLYAFQISNNSEYPAIVTNRHVLEKVKNIYLEFHPAGKDNKADPKGRIIGICITDLVWYGHPNPEIDLAFVPLPGVLNQLYKEETKPYMLYLTRENFPKPSEWASLTALEPIVTVGYPYGIWDSVNNLPILRRGVTATHPKINYRGHSQFLIDSAVYPGSSGSPVFLYDIKEIFLGEELNMGKHRPRLIGILSGVYQHQQYGEMKSTPIPTIKNKIPLVNIPNNLGIVIKSTELDGFIPLIDKTLKEQENIKSRK